MPDYQSKKHQNTWIIEIFAALALVACVFLDVFLFPDFKNNFVAFDIILILFPSIITIVTLSLSMPREKIYGIDRVRFNRLRGPWCFLFLEMIIVTIAIFLVYTICVALKYNVTMLCLEFESVFFSLYFSIQEIPLLTQSDKYIQWILKKRYYSFTPSYDLGVQQEQDDFANAICFLILTQGIKTTYISMKSEDAKKNANLLNFLLTIQNNYFFASISDLPIIQTNPSGEYRNIVFSKAMDTGFENVDDLLRLGDDFDFSEILDGKQDVYLITRSIFCLRELAEAFDLKSKEREKFQDILFTLSYQLDKNGKHQQVCLNLLNLMLCNTVPDGQMWFAEFLRDYYLPFSFFPQDREPYGLFLLCFLHSISSNSAVSPRCKQAIVTFLSEPSKSPYGNGLSLFEQARNTMGYLPRQVIVPALSALLKIYRSSSEEAYLFSIQSQGFVGSSLVPLLSESNLVDDWVEMLLYDSWAESSPDDLSEKLKTFDPQEQVTLVKTLQKNWFKNGEFDSSYIPGFLSFVGINNSPKSLAFDKQSEELLGKYANNFQLEEFMEKVKELFKTSSSYDFELKKMGNGLNLAIKNYALYEPTLKMESFPVRSFSLRFDDRFLDESIDLYIKKYDFLFGKLIKEKMDLANIVTFSRSSYRFSEKEIVQIRSFGADQMCNTSLSENIDDSVKPALKKWDLPALPRDCFWQKGAISINIEFEGDSSVARKLTSDEANQIIDHEYTMINGLYKVGDTGEIGTSVLMTREQLFNFLTQYTCLFIVSFKCAVFVDPTKILMFLPPKR